ncbi:MAG: M18 family aminopeptidase, partial [Arachnia sp.]
MSIEPSRHLDDLAAFVVASPTSYHAAEELVLRLQRAGFRLLREAEPFPSGAGSYVLRRSGAVVAWRQPERLGPKAGFRVVGTHTDSPSFKIKPGAPLISAGWRQLGVEIYGGPLLNSWLDRELGVAGRVVTRHGDVHLVRTGPIARIPQLAIHLDRQVNAEGLKLDPQRHLQPVLGLTALGEADVLGLLAERAGVAAADVVGFDVVTVDAQAPALFGTHEEFLASARLDNLGSVHAEVEALIRVQADGPAS